MEVCPVCETPHLAAALECSTCGHIFRAEAVDASIVPLADLEATRAADAQVPIEATPGLEPTRFEASPQVFAAPVEGLEPTLAAPQQVATDITPDLEPTRLVEDDLPSIFPVEVTCASCGEISQGEEVFCARCGMQLPRADRVAPQAAAPEVACTSCGGQSFAGGVCSRCGARRPPSE